MNYLKIHNDIISRAQLRASSRKEANLILGYSERHHVVPRCMGGTNEKDNLVFLSAREHFIIHILLTKIYPNEGKLLYACQRLLYTKHNERLNGKTYECLRKKISDYGKTQNKENNESIARMAETKRGRTKENNESVAKMAKTLTGRTKETHPGIARFAKNRTVENNPELQIMYNEIGKKIRGRTKETCPSIARATIKRTGRTKETHPGIARMAETKRGRTKETHPGTARQAEKCSKLPIDIQLQVYYKRINNILCKDIHEWLSNELGYEIHYSAISRITNKIKNNLSYYTSLATPV